ncbi:diphosphomevalonate decarboxylase [Zunongwangia sp. F363]|uniref:diphosphomevalonate decarboxylase n=1 Tax=Autumnicola tepida TaxID=3075595 RepID=A0ABU3C4K1_9FLAO|nr:diphosphomevalonate decarboxylase [Zunongwangia sp. F363]MDT0641273.1 diphosphomevalonate decarboxylase [Zunongwangia sp. F363]
MNVEEFIPGKYSEAVEKGSVKWQSPSNIALVKYWGKKPEQIPANPSVSFTLSNCKTITRVDFIKKKTRDKFEFEVFFEGEKKDDFKPKISTFFKRIESYCPFLKEYSFKIYSENTFPHSSGIASSASGMSALALCIMSIEKQLNPSLSAEFFKKKASFLSRLGSGSACRSIEGELVVWGEHEEIKGSSELFGVSYPDEVHENFRNYQDTILLVDKGKKEVSSSVGHDLMHGHPFAEARFKQAGANLANLIPVFAEGNLEKFMEIVENEALSLHAMMMSSRPYFILMKPNTLEIINKIWKFRRQSQLPVCFTLDAGANVHVLYPEKNKTEIFEFIKNELVASCENGQYICDQLGSGAKEIK